MSQAFDALLKERVHPVLKEAFDAYVVVGYVSDANGVRRRVAFADFGGDAAMADGLGAFAYQGAKWNDQPPAVGGNEEPT